MMRIEDMNTEDLDAHIESLKTSVHPQQTIDLVSLMQIRIGMQELGVDTVAELLARIPKSH